VQENDNERRYFMKERMQRFMAGRYGNDQLNQFIFIVAIISMVLEIITRQSLFYTLTLVLLILAYVRVFSRNINKRYEENMKFLQRKDAILNKFRKQKYYAAQRRNYHIYTCPQCKQKIRIPKGKGKISITCPKCRTSFIKKS
jgi:magnesium-transporting ATPase (P-type)